MDAYTQEMVVAKKTDQNLPRKLSEVQRQSLRGKASVLPLQGAAPVQLPSKVEQVGVQLRQRV